MQQVPKIIRESQMKYVTELTEYGINGTNIKKLFDKIQINESFKHLFDKQNSSFMDKKPHCKRLQKRVKKNKKSILEL